MKVNDPNIASLVSTEASRTQGANKAAAGKNHGANGSSAASGDDVHLSELVRSLRSLATESPERQAHLEQLARAHAAGSYNVDTHHIATKIIDDALAR